MRGPAILRTLAAIRRARPAHGGLLTRLSNGCWIASRLTERSGTSPVARALPAELGADRAFQARQTEREKEVQGCWHVDLLRGEHDAGIASSRLLRACSRFPASLCRVLVMVPHKIHWKRVGRSWC
eukprot:747186-Rhodomonas_salina.1